MIKKIAQLLAIAAIISLAAAVRADQKILQWDANAESDLAGYYIYCKSTPDVSPSRYDRRIDVPLSDDENPDPGTVERTLELSSARPTHCVVTAYDNETPSLEGDPSNVATYDPVDGSPPATVGGCRFKD